jgi:hypothetical protein
MPYQWSDLQAYRQLMPVGPCTEDDSRAYLLNAITLTANALIETKDSWLIFHIKKGGAKQGSVHTFGGYVTREDIEKQGIASALVRELGESSEIGLTEREISVQNLFGTPHGYPSILWNFGTGAVYGIVKIPLTAAEVQERMDAASAEESLTKKLFAIPQKEISHLEAKAGMQQYTIHPQTAQVLETMIALYE